MNILRETLGKKRRKEEKEREKKLQKHQPGADPKKQPFFVFGIADPMTIFTPKVASVPVRQILDSQDYQLALQEACSGWGVEVNELEDPIFRPPIDDSTSLSIWFNQCVDFSDFPVLLYPLPGKSKSRREDLQRHVQALEAQNELLMIGEVCAFNSRFFEL